MPTHRNLTLWRGNTETIAVRLITRAAGAMEPVDLTGSRLVFSAVWPGGSIEKDLAVTDAAQGHAELRLSVAETRSIPVGPGGSYEIERRVGIEQKTILYGALAAAGGLNTDS